MNEWRSGFITGVIVSAALLALTFLSVRTFTGGGPGYRADYHGVPCTISLESECQ